MRHIALLPTLFTLANGVCGFYALIKIGAGLTESDPGEQVHAFHMAAYLILAAMVFDALDGRVARMTQTASNFGAQLDSLCDLVTFGVAPAFLIYAICHKTGFLPSRVIEVVVVLYVICALIRLARFNVETDASEKSHLQFAGLPSPAAAGLIASAIIPWSAFRDWRVLAVLSDTLLQGLPIMAFALAVLMVSRVPYLHVANRLFRGVRPFVTLVELILLAVVVALLHEFALFLAFFAYTVVSPIVWLRNRLHRKPEIKESPAQADRDDSLF